MTDAAQATRILIRGGRVYDHDGDVHQPAPGRHPGRWRDGSSASGPNLPAGDAQVIDAAGKLVVPGFINAHYHSHDVMAKGLFEEMPFDIWTLHSNPAKLWPARPRGGTAAHADRRGRDAAQRHHHGAGFSRPWCRRTKRWSTRFCRPTRRPASAWCLRLPRATAPRSILRRSFRRSCRRPSANASPDRTARPAMNSASSPRRSSGVALRPNPAADLGAGAVGAAALLAGIAGGHRRAVPPARPAGFHSRL